MTGSDLVSLLRAQGYAPHSYSGRMMHGRRCVAVSSQPSQPAFEIEIGADLMAECAEREDWDMATMVREAVRGTRSDSMGLGIVVYWPEVEWPEGEEEGDE